MDKTYFDIELRLGADRTLRGSIPYNSLSKNLGGFVEKLNPGCFSESLRSGEPVLCFYNHNSSEILGNTSAGTLRLNDTPMALRFECDVPDNSWGNDVLISVKRRDITGCSFGFRCQSDKWDRSEKTNVRTILNATLIELSPVSQPAYSSTSVRGRNEKMDTSERSLRNQMYEHFRRAEDVHERARNENRSLSRDENNVYVEAMNDAEAIAQQLVERGYERFVPDFRTEGMKGLRAWFNSPTRDAVERPIPARSGASHTTRDDDSKKMIEFRSFLRGERRDLQLSSDTAGGFLAPTQYLNEVVRELEQLVVIRRLSRHIPVNKTDTVNIPKLASRPNGVSWTSELAVGGESTMTFEGISFVPKPRATWLLLSNDLAESTPIPIEEHIKRELTYAFAIDEEQKFISGTGAGEPLGFMIAGSGGAGVSTARDVSIGNSTTELKADNIFEVYYSLRPAYAANASWVFHPTTLKHLRKLKSGGGDFLWQISLQGGEPGRLLERPVYTSEFMPSTYSAGSYIGVLADFRCYWIVELTQLRIKILDQLYAMSNQTAYVCRGRMDAAPIDELGFARVTLAT